MSAEKSPRQRLRRLIKRGDTPAPALFVPLVHAVAARIEGWDVPTFLTDPTKLARGLTSLHEMLGNDAIICCNAAGVAAEALGAAAGGADHAPLAAAPETAVERVLAHARVTTGLEVVRRLGVTVAGDPLFAIVMPGPATLAMQLATPAADGGRTWHAGAHAILELCTRIEVALCRSFGEAGGHLFVLSEDVVPADDGGRPDGAWLSALTSIMNVIRFYQALPVLLPQTASGRATEVLASPFDQRFLCLGDDLTGASGGDEVLGRALTGAPAAWQVPGGRFGLLTTAAEVAATAEIADLDTACARVRGALAATP